MKYSFKAWFYGHFFHSLCKPQYKAAGVTGRNVCKIVKEHKAITVRAKDMNDEKLLSSYIMGIYFIAMNRCTGLSPEDNYKILESGLKNSSMFRKGLGTAEAYLDEKNLSGQRKAKSERMKIIGCWMFFQVVKIMI